MLLVGGIIHLLPLSGALGSERLASLYGIPFADINLIILMRHRAILFGILGLFLVLAIFRVELRFPAFIAGLVSVVSFLALAQSAGDYNAQLSRVCAVDVLALVCLAVGLAAHVRSQRVGTKNG